MRAGWRRWGPYLSERQWGTVREDYSETGTPGTTAATIRPARGPTAGARTAWPASPTTRSGSSSPWPSPERESPGTRPGSRLPHAPDLIVDPDFAKQQIELMLRGLYLHPSGQMPAYEWNFSDVNPPVHAWATLSLYRTEQALRGEGDLDFLRSAFNKLALNFTWWVNRKDRFGKNVFEGGFLGLDNIGVFDRSAPLPTRGHLEQADGTAWMALFTQNMLELTMELAAHDRTYEDMAFKFAEHFSYIAAAMNQPGPDGMWDEDDAGLYYDLATVGYGDVTPATPIAGTLAWLEAVTGQLYLAITVAGSWRCRWPRARLRHRREGS